VFLRAGAINTNPSLRAICSVSDNLAFAAMKKGK